MPAHAQGRGGVTTRDAGSGEVPKVAPHSEMPELASCSTQEMPFEVQSRSEGLMTLSGGQA